MAVSSTGTYWIVVTQVRGTAANAVLHDQAAKPTVQNTYASTDVQGPYDGLNAALAQLKRLTITGSVNVVDSSSKVLGSVDVATGTTSTSGAAGGASQPSNPQITRGAVNTQDPGSDTGTSSPGTPFIGALIKQPGFAPQLTALPTPIGSSNQVGNIQRGYMIWDQPMTASYGTSGGPLGDGRDMINFLFNPSTVTSDYSVGNVSLQGAMLYQVPGDNGNLLSPLLQQTVTWQLYFDRTFELLYGTPTKAKNDPTVIGCQADVLQFMQFTGVLASGSAGSYASNSTVTANQGTTTANNGQNVNQAGIMMMVPCWVFFGNAFNQTNTQTAFGGQPNFEAVGTQMAFYGFISEWSVQYTHWTANMVPIRCVISVSFTMMPTSSQTPGAAAVWQDTAKLQHNYVTAPIYPTLNGKAPASLFNR
jgi:hypothetical protein